MMTSAELITALTVSLLTSCHDPARPAEPQESPKGCAVKGPLVDPNGFAVPEGVAERLEEALRGRTREWFAGPGWNDSTEAWRDAQTRLCAPCYADLIRRASVAELWTPAPWFAVTKLECLAMEVLGTFRIELPLMREVRRRTSTLLRHP